MQPSGFTNSHFHKIFFHAFDLVKNTKKRRGQQKERGTYETRYSSGPIWDFKVEFILFKTPLDFFNFIDLQPRNRTWIIGYPFNFEIPVITAFSRGTKGSGKQGVCVCVCVVQSPLEN